MSLFELHILICCFQGLWHETKGIQGLEWQPRWQIQRATPLNRAKQHDLSCGKIVTVPHPDEISCSEVESDHPPLLYDGPIPINLYKIKDLNKITKKYIPEPQHSFYKTLVPEENTKSDSSAIPSSSSSSSSSSNSSTAPWFRRFGWFQVVTNGSFKSHHIYGSQWPTQHPCFTLILKVIYICYLTKQLLHIKIWFLL